jgi:2,4-dienoyl-CoA reductase (NADPH2)
VELLAEVARDMEPVTRKMTMRRLQDLPVTVHTSTRLLRITDGTAHVEAEGGGGEEPLGEFDSVVVAVGHRPFDPLSAALRESGVAVTVIGDADRPGQILDATRAGQGAVLPPADA